MKCMKLRSLAITVMAAVGLLSSTIVRADDSALMEPVKSVLNQYLTIQTNGHRQGGQGR